MTRPSTKHSSDIYSHDPDKQTPFTLICDLEARVMELMRCSMYIKQLNELEQKRWVGQFTDEQVEDAPYPACTKKSQLTWQRVLTLR